MCASNPDDGIIFMCMLAVKFIIFFIYYKIHCKCESCCITLFSPNKKKFLIKSMQKY